jgi:predicted  nucleic acid-binding Zn-ribbon protein
MAKNETYEKLDQQLREWGIQIDVLKARAAKAKDELKAEYEQLIANLTNKSGEAQKKLSELKKAGAEAKEDLKVGIEKAWKDLSQAIDKAKSRIK